MQFSEYKKTKINKNTLIELAEYALNTETDIYVTYNTFVTRKNISFDFNEANMLIQFIYNIRTTDITTVQNAIKIDKYQT